ncbi:MAG: sugar ABC transporter permease [Spirochaetia bacterium]|jgi:ABC-type sugar transport system permease subunit
MPGILGTIRKNRWHYAYLFILPILVVFGLFRIYPSLQTLVYSFFDINLVARSLKPVGVRNFLLLVHDATFLKAISNTLIFALYIVLISTAIGLVLASMFTSGMRGTALFKAVYFAPFITSTVAAAVVWTFLYNPRFGLFNSILQIFGLPTKGWISSSKDALTSIIIFSIWKTVGYNMVIFIAGLQNIPDSFHEAAIIDGAGGIRRFFTISLPLVAPTTVFVVMYNTILALKVFDQVFVLTAGGPADATTVVVLQIYKQAFENYRFGYASSMAFVLFVIIISVTVVQYRLSRRWEVSY